jgi:hypothetical protein
MGNANNFGRSEFWKPEPVQLPAHLASDKWISSLREKTGVGECSALDAADHAFKQAKNTFNALADLRVARDPRQTPAAHMESVKNQSRKALDATVNNIHKANNRISEKRAELERTMAERCKFGTTPLGSEIRAYVRSLKPQERNGFISDAIKKGNHTVYNSILEGPADLSGIKEDSQRAYRDMVVKEHAPDLLKHEEALQRAYSLNMDLLDSAIDTTSEIEKFRENEEQIASEHDEALARLNSGQMPLE